MKSSRSLRRGIKAKLAIIITVIILVAIASGVVYYYTQIIKPSLPSEFKLGAVLDYTGVFAACAKAEEIGIRLAVDEINAGGGLFGKIPIRLITRDGESKPEVQLTRFRELVEIDKIHAGLGTCHAGGAYSLMVESLKAGAVYWPSPVMAYEAFKKGTRAPWTFSAWVPTWSVGYAMCTFAVRDLGLKRVYFFARTDAWGWGIRDGCKAALEKYGGEMIGYDEFTLGTPDYTPYITRMIAAKPEIVISTTFGGDQVTFLKQALELGLSRVTKIMVFTSHLVLKGIPAEALEGIYATIYFYHDIPEGLVDSETLKSIKEFTEKVMKIAGEPPDPYTFVNYVEVKAMIKAFERLGKIEGITPEEFMKAVLELPAIETAKGPLRFTEMGLPIFKYGFFLGVGKGPADRTTPYDYLKIVRVIGGEEVLPPKEILGY